MLRRQLLQGFAAAALIRKSPPVAYVATYSSPQGPEGSKGNGQGIYLFEQDAASGRLTQRQLFENAANPSWLAFHPSGAYLYAAEEVQSGAVTAYRVARASGNLARLNSVSSGGAGPTHLSLHPTGKHLFVANYFGGSFAVLPINPDGSLAAASDVQQDTGGPGPTHALSAPPGSFAISGHERTHGHMIESDPAGKFILGSDLGTDRIHVWKFNPVEGKLISNNEVALPAGDGPRHFAFHPNGRWFYSLQEEGSTLALFHYDAAAGQLTLIQQISSLPPQFAGTNFTSEIRIAPNGKFLYAANRLHDSIAVFAIGSSGRLTFASETWTRGDYPRSFTIDPTGAFLYSCNQRSDAITCFRLDRASGALQFTGQYTPVGTPSMIVFLP